jgi:hypothetical protein
MPAKKKLLFVDDRSKRIHSALRKYSKHYDVTIAPNVPEALRLISSEDWTIVSLDADLNGYDFCDPNSKDSGMEIIRYLDSTLWPEGKPSPTFIIHSSNALVAELMFQYLLEWMTLRGQDRALVIKERFVYDEEE